MGKQKVDKIKDIKTPKEKRKEEIDEFNTRKEELNVFRKDSKVIKAILVLQNKLDKANISVDVYQALEDYMDVGLDAIKGVIIDEL